jgi:Xaa-Pro aminopeptidase
MINASTSAHRVSPIPGEGVGPSFDIDAMRFASQQSWIAVQAMADALAPGMREAEAIRIGRAILKGLGVERIWHPIQVRFGKNTLKTFRQKSDPEVVLGADDIYFIDLGPVFRGHEGDVGATFTTGVDPEKAACAMAAKALFDDVRVQWSSQGSSGPALYAYAERRAREMGWRFNLGTQGHRVGDFPHSIHRGGTLGAFGSRPSDGIWVLEIQIAHPEKPFGAFYEDVLLQP